MDLHFDPSVWIAAYGYWAVFVLIGLESMGVPLPGETVLVAAAIYAGTGHELNIFGVVAAAATGAVIGDNIGYEIGRLVGFPSCYATASASGLTSGGLSSGSISFAVTEA